MPLLTQPDCRNRLLSLMSKPDFARLASDLEPLKLDRGLVIAEPDGVFEHVIFPDTAVVSIVAVSPEGQKVEAGLVGRDGLSPAASVLGLDRVPNKVMVQIPGHGTRLSRTALVKAVEESPSLRALLLRYLQVFTVQTSFTALSNAVHTIDERLSRWLLMCHDRVDSDDLPLTHEFMSIMLAVRRPSVTTALHVLEGNGLIRAVRGRVTVSNRQALEDFAADAYGKPEAEYRRLIGAM